MYNGAHIINISFNVESVYLSSSSLKHKCAEFKLIYLIHLVNTEL